MKKIILFLFVCFFLVGCVFLYNTRPPTDVSFPIEVQFNTDQPLSTFIAELHQKKIISNVKLFKIILVVNGYDKKLKPNIYTFTHPQDIFSVAYSLATDSSQARGVKVVIPEGSTVKEIEGIVHKTFPLFETLDKIPAFTQTDEGYLFPDTYFFSINSTEGEIIAKLKQTFDEKTKTLFTGKTEQQIKDIVIMASIIEKEGRNVEERKMISGILWKRIEIGMPLQVDATFLYTKGKGTSELTLDDLKEDSLYNTYTRTGLPIAPINNPGLETIDVALNPTPSPYLFYLHDKDGIIHYAKTFPEHIKNKNKYLK